CSKRSPRKPASSSRWPCSMVPMPPSRIRMRSASAASSRATRSGCSQGRVLIGCFSLLLLLREQADDFEMRRLALAAEPVAADHLQVGGAGVVLQLGFGEAEVAVVERFHRGAVVVLAQRHREQAAAGAQQ